MLRLENRLNMRILNRKMAAGSAGRGRTLGREEAVAGIAQGVFGGGGTMQGGPVWKMGGVGRIVRRGGRSRLERKDFFGEKNSD